MEVLISALTRAQIMRRATVAARYVSAPIRRHSDSAAIPSPPAPAADYSVYKHIFSIASSCAVITYGSINYTSTQIDRLDNRIDRLDARLTTEIGKVNERLDGIYALLADRLPPAPTKK